MTGDVEGWERARTALTGACARARQTGAETVGTSFTIDVLQTGKGRISSFLTVGYPPSDNQIRRELGRYGSVCTLDYFTPGRHEAVTLLPGAPAYADVSRSVMEYLDNSRSCSASTDGPVLANAGCEFTRR